jgi:hypothetical protein
LKKFSSHILDEEYLHERVLGQEMQAAAIRSFDALRTHFVKKFNEGMTKLWNFYDSERKGGRDIVKSQMAMGKTEAKAIADLYTFNSGFSWLDGGSNGIILMFNSKSVKGLSVIPSFIDKAGMKNVGGDFLMVRLMDNIPNAGGTFCATRHGCLDATININLSSGNNPVNMRFRADAAMMVLNSKTSGKAREKIRNLTQSVSTMFNAYRSIYIHEYTHYLDEIRYKGKPSKAITNAAKVFWDDKQKDKTAYYTGENEVNARLAQVEGMSRKALRHLMVAFTSDATAHEALIRLKKANMATGMTNAQLERVFNGAGQEILKNGLVAQEINLLSYEKLWRLRDEVLPQWMESLAFSSLRTRDPFAALVAYMVYINLNREAIEAWNKNPRLLKKVMSRLYGVIRELKRQQENYIKDVKAGRIPSGTEWTSAIAACRHSYGTIMYAGHFMQSKSTEVYKVKKPYRFLDYNFG